MAEDIPYDKNLELVPGTRRRADARRAARAVQQPEPVHLQGHGELHRRPRQSRHHRSRPRRSRPQRGAARRGARRDRDAYFRHPHPPRPFARRAGDQGGDRRAGSGRRPAPRRARAPCRRRAAARILQRHRLQARPRARRRRGGERRRLDARGRDHARPHRQPHGLRLQGEQRAVLRRSRHGLVDAGGGAAGRLDGRLHGLAAKALASAPSRSISPATAAR